MLFNGQEIDKVMFNGVEISSYLWNNQELLASLAKLAKEADAKLYLDARKANGSAAGANSPFTSPFVDLTGSSNNATLTNFAGTTADGYIKLPILSAIGSPYNFVNLLGNDGNFGVDTNADGLADGWTSDVALSTKSINGNVQSFVAGGQFAGVKKQTALDLIQNIGDVFFGCAYVKASSNLVRLRMQNAGGASALSHSGSGLFEFMSFRLIKLVSVGKILAVQDERTTGFNEVQVMQFHLLNLTTIFGAGNEPTKDQMDVIVQKAIETYGYINERMLKIAWMDFLATDGVDSYGSIVDNGSLDFVGTQDFAFSGVFVTPSVLQVSRLISKGIALPTNEQFGVRISVNGELCIVLNGNITILSSANAIKPSSVYTFFITRKSNTLNCKLNGTVIYSQANSTSINTNALITLFALPNDTNRSTNVAFFKGFTALLTAHGASVTEEKLNKFCDKAFKAYQP